MTRQESAFGHTCQLATTIVLMTIALAVPVVAATVPTPTISAPVTGPGPMYPNPAISIVPGATTVESFPYITEEYIVSGTVNDAPYSTRIIVRRPKDPA